MIQTITRVQHRFQLTKYSTGCTPTDGVPRHQRALDDRGGRHHGDFVHHEGHAAELGGGLPTERDPSFGAYNRCEYHCRSVRLMLYHVVCAVCVPLSSRLTKNRRNQSNPSSDSSKPPSSTAHLPSHPRRSSPHTTSSISLPPSSSVGQTRLKKPSTPKPSPTLRMAQLGVTCLEVDQEDTARWLARVTSCSIMPLVCCT